MPFPDSQRVIYKINPLDQVICQLRFPAILRIDTQPPYEFQEIIRHDFPLYFEGKEFLAEIPIEVLSQIPQDVVGNLSLPAKNKMNYRFISADGNWTINLTNNFIALTTKKYDRWENFKAHLQEPLEAFIKIYSPAFISRIGLRYVDVIRRSLLGLTDSDWSELIHPYILGILAASNIDRSIITGSLATDEMQLDEENNTARLLHGLATLNTNNETVYLIDCDFFSENRTEIQDVIYKLDKFNRVGSRLFRWCITDKLHDAMQPEHL